MSSPSATFYLCRLSSLHNNKVEEVLVKRRLGDVQIQFRRNRLTLDGRDPVYVGWLPGARGGRRGERERAGRRRREALSFAARSVAQPVAA